MESGDSDNHIEPDSDAQEAADSRNWAREGYAKIRHLMPEHHQLILEMRYGFGEFEGQQNTLEDVAKKMNVTRERVRQIEAKILALLSRHHPRPRPLDMSDFF